MCVCVWNYHGGLSASPPAISRQSLTRNTQFSFCQCVIMAELLVRTGFPSLRPSRCLLHGVLHSVLILFFHTLPAARCASTELDRHTGLQNVSQTIQDLLDGYDIRLRPQFGGEYITSLC